MAGPCLGDCLGDRFTLQLQRHAALGKFRNLHRVLPFCFLNLSYASLPETMKCREFEKLYILLITITCVLAALHKDIGARDICHRATSRGAKCPPGGLLQRMLPPGLSTPEGTV